ncbi:MAG: cysteine methyltransferase, partial [Mycobacterium sp.]|nr:cysteine methyltransferase [Mycobacterium sp.]
MTTNLFDELDADDDALAWLHQRLEHAADTEGLLDVAYRTIDTPVGTLLLAATTAGLVRVAYDIEDHEAVLAELADRISPRLLRAPARLD